MKLKPLLSLVILLSFVTGIRAQVFPGLKQSAILCGSDRTEVYLPLIGDKKIGLVANPTSRVGSLHLLDTLIRSRVKVGCVFAPEHGFRGEGEAGAVITDGIDQQTGVPVISLYGNHKKPTTADLAGLDMVLFDIQDVGVRFYTYISTLHYVMEACGREHIPLMVLDRPNPNGFYIDGPILDTAYQSFTGMHTIPVVHGMTIGEYAQMINGEHWLPDGNFCELAIIRCTGYDHQTEYVLPVKPSPNLPNQVSVYLYPSLCFFEGSTISIGRGTDFPFQVYGNPLMKGDFRFTPTSIPGVSLHPLYENQECFGRDLRQGGVAEVAVNPCIRVEWIIEAYLKMNQGDKFFIGYFDTLAGTDLLRKQIILGKSADEIRSTWTTGLHQYQKMRKKYLLYPDSEWCQLR